MAVEYIPETLDRVMMIFDGPNAQYKIAKKHGGALYYIHQTSGKKPQRMQGMFTSILAAEQQIRNFLQVDMKVLNTAKNNKEGVEDKLKNQKGVALDG